MAMYLNIPGVGPELEIEDSPSDEGYMHVGLS
jgi:hypothetical protein